MTVTWYKTAERPPTEADLHPRGLVYVLAFDPMTGMPDRYDFNDVAQSHDICTHWRPLTNDDFPPRERKLDPAWRELRADSWEGVQHVWIVSVTGRPWMMYGRADSHNPVGKYWQPAITPRIWEEET